MLSKSEIKDFLDEKVEQYRQPFFIQEDPIQIPLSFTRKQDIEIAGFFSALIAWGNRASIIKDGNYIMDLMDRSPYEYVMEYRPGTLQTNKTSLHRTFMTEDLDYLLLQLRRLYEKENSLEAYFMPQEGEPDMMDAIERFRTAVLSLPHRASKHISSPASGSAAKRLQMFLRWMVRDDHIDLGIWKNISPALLSLPLDVHTARVARSLKLLKRKSNDRKAVQELDKQLRKMDAQDPVKYDFALFGLGVYEGFGK